MAVPFVGGGTGGGLLLQWILSGTLHTPLLLCWTATDRPFNPACGRPLYPTSNSRRTGPTDPPQRVVDEVYIRGTVLLLLWLYCFAGFVQCLIHCGQSTAEPAAGLQACTAAVHVRLRGGVASCLCAFLACPCCAGGVGLRKCREGQQMQCSQPLSIQQNHHQSDHAILLPCCLLLQMPTFCMQPPTGVQAPALYPML